MKYLVTGGAGFIGSHLADALIEKGNDVLIIDNFFSGKKENINPKAIFFQLDIRDFKKVRPLFNGVDAVFHLAAIPSVQFSIKNPVESSSVNILGTINVFKSAAEAKVKKVIFSSSSAVYGEQNKFPIKETAKAEPISPYGLQKLAGEQFAKLFSKIYNLEAVSLRYFNVYGERMNFDSEYSSVVGNFLKFNLNKKPLTIFGDGKQTRSFCYVKDVVRANILALGSNKLCGGKVFNIGSKDVCSINDLAKLIGGNIKYFPERKGDLKRSEPDIVSAKKVILFEPEIDIKKGILLTKNWFQKNYRGNESPI